MENSNTTWKILTDKFWNLPKLLTEMSFSLSALLSLCLAADPYDRAVKIVDQMTLDEKFSLIQGAGHTASGGGTYVGVIKGLRLLLF